MKLRLKLFIIFQVFFLLVCSLHGEDPSQLEGVIRVGIFPFEPMNFIDENGIVQGLYPDLLREILSDENISLTFVEGSWAQGLERLENEEIDLIFSVAYTEERDRVLDFNIESVVELWGQVFTRPEDKSININDLHGQKVGIMAKDINGQNFINTAAELGIKCEIIEFATHNDIFEAVDSGVLVAGVAPQHFGLRHANSYDLIPSSILFSPFSIYFASKEGKQAPLLRLIDKQLLRWKDDKNSFYYQNLARWMSGENFRQNVVPPWMITVLLTISAAAGSAFLFVFLLRSQVIKKTNELMKKERQYRDLVENADSIILRIDKKGHILFANKYCLDYFGYRIEDLIGENTISRVFSEENNLNNWINEEKISFVDEFQLKIGTTVFIQWNNKVVSDNNGLLEEILCIGINISNRLQVEKDLQESNKQLEEMVYIASHDLQVPLVSMEGYASELLENYKGRIDEEATYCLTRLQVNSRRMHKLVLSLLDISRLNTVHNYYSDFSMIDVISKIENDISLLLEDVKGVVLYGNLPSLHADRSRIEGVFRNIVINAFNYGSHEVHISFSGGIFQIKDDGIGIPESQLERIFNPGERLKIHEAEGVGMGLTFCRKVVEQHRGAISVESEGKDKGSSFYIKFPDSMFVKDIE